jgi:hypothetical protein
VETRSVWAKQAYSAGLKKHIISPKKPSILEAAASTHCFPMRSELVLKRILPANRTFQGGEMLIFFQ